MWRYIQEDAIEGPRAAAVDAFLAAAYARGGTIPDPTLRVFTYRPNTLLLGRFQSAAAQFRLDECKRLGITAARRLLGGGAVLMGEQQVAVSLTTCADHPATPSRPNDLFMVYGNAVCRGLRHFGIECRFRPRHDFMVGNRTVGSADARVSRAGALLFHAHVLLDFDEQQAARILRLPGDVSVDSAASALSARLSSLRHEKGQPVEPSTVRDFVRVAFEAGFGIEFQEFPITPLENDGIAQLQRERYGAQPWLDECSPTPRMTGAASRQTPGGLLLAFASRTGEQIDSVLLAGDFFGDPDAVAAFQDSLRGAQASAETIRAAADQHLGPALLEGIDSADIADAVFEAVSAAGSAASLPDQARGLPQSFL